MPCKLARYYLVLCWFFLLGCSQTHVVEQAEQPCTPAWYQAVEAKVTTGDGLGHGPDVGSDEWKSVIEFKLGIRGDPSIPERNTPQWCEYIDNLVLK
ncbi:hypothetical protein LP316_01145 [Thalassotalea sp. LPB0316]|uniref:hypothetical protein n=1 Tax=Thalassotalea sp. LPB0316 TaxID=2769490 RepID=UPI001866EB9A|nr:hypothetical protein [Thalassotalea sp. LPB0316]QOL25952.1 hypothetical protein LP316_01145 [Thalassotalea sp. LPB0316]